MLHCIKVDLYNVALFDVALFDAVLFKFALVPVGLVAVAIVVVSLFNVKLFYYCSIRCCIVLMLHYFDFSLVSAVLLNVAPFYYFTV